MINVRRKFLTSTALVALMVVTACGKFEGKEAEKPQSDGAEESTIVWPRANVEKFHDDKLEAEVDAILARMSLEEKVGQIIQADSASVTPDDVRTYNLGSVLSGGNSAPGDLPYATAEQWVTAADAYFEASVDDSDGGVSIPIIWGIDAVHGHNNVIGGTIFPHNIGLGAAQNPELIRKISAVTARELRVTGHDWTFAPTLAVPQDDRWGRSYEGFSETPEIVRAYATAIVEGLQGAWNSDNFMGAEQVISTAKHFVGDGGTAGGQDQGDAQISEKDLRDIHGIAYLDAINAGVQSIMASFSSWNGNKVHGSEYLLTNVLKEQMGFDGFIVGDWNAHGQIDGCTTESCPAVINAGLDMFMAPDSWKGLYVNTLQQVKDGVISEERLNDAVRRILRVKLRSGVFGLSKPSERKLAGDMTVLGSPEHKAVAREAVRESLVLLKNNGGVLPVKPGQHVLVLGKSADSISDASGGWTLTWQGGGLPNSAFPNGESILSGFEKAVKAAGGTIEYSVDGTYSQKPDVAIAVYGEKPYAEFQGDVNTLLYMNPEVKDQLGTLKSEGISTVSVYLSGRPMWVNPLLNVSDAFVAAWWPGSEGAGVADVLVADKDGDVVHGFTGKLSFSWPKKPDQGPLNVGQNDYDPLFAYGYGLTYADSVEFGPLSEDLGSAKDSANKYNYYEYGRSQAPWQLVTEGVRTASVDHDAQEDALAIVFEDAMPASVALQSSAPVDLFREMNGAMELTFAYRLDAAVTAPVNLSMGCVGDSSCQGALDITKSLSGTPVGEWSIMRISLSCFERAGADIRSVGEPFKLSSKVGTALSVADIKVAEDTDGQETCQ